MNYDVMRYGQFLRYRQFPDCGKLEASVEASVCEKLRTNMLRLAFFLAMLCVAAPSFGQEDTKNLESRKIEGQKIKDQKVEAQKIEGQKVYDCVAVAKMDNSIFRGELAEKYTYAIKGTAYAYSDEFGMGNIIFNGKLYMGVFLNLNSHRDELQLKASESGIKASLGETRTKVNSGEAGAKTANARPGTASADDGINIALKKELVGDFSIGERNYTTLCGENAVKGLKEGYYEVIYRSSNGYNSSNSSNGACNFLLVKRHYKNVTEKMNSITGKIETTFNSKHKYFLVADGSVRGVKNEKNLAKICRGMNNGDKRGQIKEFLRLNKGKGSEGKGSEELMRGIMVLIEK